MMSRVARCAVPAWAMAAAITCTPAHAQESNPTNDLPNPYVGRVLELPGGRQWGSTAGVDIEMRRSMWDFLRKVNAEGTTIILTTHYLEEAEALCRHIAIINRGSIVENTSVRELLRRLHREVFILDSVEILPPDPGVPGFPVRRLDDHTLEVEVEKGQHINAVFASLDARGIHISSMRNRANRLEEMFVNLVESAA